MEGIKVKEADCDIRTVKKNRKSFIKQLATELREELKDATDFRAKIVEIDPEKYKPSTVVYGLRRAWKGTPYKVAERVSGDSTVIYIYKGNVEVSK